MTYYEPRLPCEPTQIGRFRRALGEEGLEQLLKAAIETAVEIKAIKPAEPERGIVDTTVQEKAMAHPVDSRLLEIARHVLSCAAGYNIGWLLRAIAGKAAKDAKAFLLALLEMAVGARLGADRAFQEIAHAARFMSGGVKQILQGRLYSRCRSTHFAPDPSPPCTGLSPVVPLCDPSPLLCLPAQRAASPAYPPQCGA